MENLQETLTERKPPFYTENLEALRNPQWYNRELFIKLKVANVNRAWSARPVQSAQTHPSLGRGRWDISVALNNSGLEMRRTALVMLRVFVMVWGQQKIPQLFIYFKFFRLVSCGRTGRDWIFNPLNVKYMFCYLLLQEESCDLTRLTSRDTGWVGSN